MEKVPYLIVGQGIAGTVMGLTLEMAGCQVAVVDPALPQTSSRVAAGIFNPITGPRYTKTWQCESVWASLVQFYPKAERFLGTRFHYPASLFRPYNTIEEQNYVMGKSADPDYEQYIGTDMEPWTRDWVKAPHGGFMVNYAGRIDTNTFLDAYKAHKESQALFYKAKVEPTDFEKHPQGGFVWNNIHFSTIIWCTGWEMSQMPMFAHVTLAPVKGEVLEVKVDEDLPGIISGKVYAVPGLHAGQLLVGATYDNHNLNETPTADGRAELEAGLAQLLNRTYQIVGHRAGIRPATPQRRPILGTLPGLPRMAFMNGLGTKGVSLAPFVAMQLLLHLEAGQPLTSLLSSKKRYIYTNSKDDFAMQFLKNS